MHLDPLSGYLFVFKNKRADRIKLLYWDRDGLAIWYKVLQKGTFKFPDLKNISSAGLEIDAATLRLILDGVDLRSIRKQSRFQKNCSPPLDTFLPVNKDSRGAQEADRQA